MKNLFNLLTAALVLTLVNGCEEQKKEYKTQYKSEGELYREKISQGNYQQSLWYFLDVKFGEVDEASKELQFKYEYDRQGNVISTTSKDYDTKNFKIFYNTTYIEYEQDPEKNTTRRTITDKDGNIIGIVVESFDASTGFSVVESYDGQGKLNYKDEMTFDEQGRMLTQKSYNKEGKLTTNAYLDPNSTEDERTTITKKDGEVTRETETRIDQFTVRTDFVKQDPDESYYVVVRYNQKNLEVETLIFSLSGILQYATRIEWVKFPESSNEPD